jgi:adenylate cyclase
MNAQRGSSLKMGVALHLGEVMYGNIGSHQRLDFTVIGAAVNEAARVESLCKKLGASLLVTGAFADALGREGLRSLGTHVLQGVTGGREVFTLPFSSPAPAP